VGSHVFFFFLQQHNKPSLRGVQLRAYDSDQLYFCFRTVELFPDGFGLKITQVMAEYSSTESFQFIIFFSSFSQIVPILLFFLK
jgi:hypothetical protein